MKKDNWIRKRHSVISNILRPFVMVYLRMKYNFKRTKYILPKEGAIILSNHTTALDPFFVGSCFDKNLYYMASKDLFQKRFVGKLIEFLVKPIPKEKSNKSDIKAIRDCIQVSKEKGNICIFPEGNRTFSGKLCNVDYSIVKLIKLLKKPLIICNVIGGYASDPRWSNTRRKGKIEVIIRNSLQYKDYQNMDNDELYSLIIDNLQVDDYALNIPFKGKNKAEYLESILFVCPICHKQHQITTNKDFIECRCCNNKIKYNDNLLLISNNSDFKFKYVYEWYEYQIDFLKNMVVNNEIIFKDKMKMYEPILYKKKKFIGEGELILNESSFIFVDSMKKIVLKFDDIYSVTLLGRKKMNIYYLDKVYQFDYNRRTNLIKYMLMFYIIKNKKENNLNGFIGI